MRILAIADEESQYYWDFYEKGKLDGIDLIISCGDLDPGYLEFLETFANVPVLYVHGNHDLKYGHQPPEGCFCIDDKIYIHNGVRILGLGGCMRYNNSTHQYTEHEMMMRIFKLGAQILWHGGFDILVTHAPAYELNDGKDLPHRGFMAFRKLMDLFKPKYFLHGHVHMTYGREHKRLDTYNKTQVINAFERYVFDYTEEQK